MSLLQQPESRSCHSSLLSNLQWLPPHSEQQPASFAMVIMIWLLGCCSVHLSKLSSSPLRKSLHAGPQAICASEFCVCCSFRLDHPLPTQSQGLFLHFGQVSVLMAPPQGRKHELLSCLRWYLVTLNPFTLLCSSSYWATYCRFIGFLVYHLSLSPECKIQESRNAIHFLL